MLRSYIAPALLACAIMSSVSAAGQDESMMPPELSHPAAPPAAPAGHAGSTTSDMETSGESHSVTTTSSSSFGISLAPDSGGFGGHVHSPAQSLAGRWKLASGSDNSSCGITLTTKKWSGDTMLASIPAGCPGGLFSANNWRISGSRLDLNNGSGEVAASFRSAGFNRWRGRINSTGQDVSLTR